MRLRFVRDKIISYSAIAKPVTDEPRSAAGIIPSTHRPNANHAKCADRIPNIRGLDTVDEFRLKIVVHNETIAVIVRYLAHDPSLSPLDAFLLATHQAAPNREGFVKRGTSTKTEMHLEYFWTGLGTILVVLGGCCFLGMLSKVAMMNTKYDDLDLESSSEQVARLAIMETGRRQERQVWYMKLHPRFPRITVSTDSTLRGNWAEKDVVNKQKED